MRRFSILLAALWCSLGVPLAAAPLSLAENIRAIWSDKSGVDGGFTFIVVGDNRSGDAVYREILEQALSYKPLFILNTGDLVNHGDSSEFDAYAKLIETLSVPIVHVPGNHDRERGLANWKRRVGEPNWYFEYGSCRFIGLDNSTGEFSREALAFAHKYINNEKTCFVAFHKPPAVGRWKVHSMDGGKDQDQVMSLIRAAACPMVFLGHIHLYDSMEIDGTDFIISAGGGAGLYSKYKFGKPEHGFVVVRVSKEGITHEWIRVK
ncbi:MAG: metallophosphoesterase [bacterium]